MSSQKEYLEQNKERFVEELFELLRIPSISADSAYKNDVLKKPEAEDLSNKTLIYSDKPTTLNSGNIFSRSA